jgi:hypothetical protein
LEPTVTTVHQPRPHAVLLTACPQLQRDVTTLAHLADTSLGTIIHPDQLDPLRLPRLLLAGPDIASEPLVGKRLRHPQLIIISYDVTDSSIWWHADRLGAGHVAFLPQAAVCLAGRLRAATHQSEVA